MWVPAFVLLAVVSVSAADQAADAQTFIKTAAQEGMKEVQLGMLGADRATHPDLKKFSRQMAEDHNKMNMQLKELAAKKNVTLDQSAQAMKFENLMNLKGEQFDRAFMGQVIQDHNTSIQLYEQQSTSGQDPDVKAFATNTLPHLRAHLEMAQKLSDRIGKGAAAEDTRSDRSIEVRHDAHEGLKVEKKEAQPAGETR